jgi:hypothetical protein
MAAQAPVDWTGIFDSVKESVFFVLMEPKEDMLDDLLEVADRVETVQQIEECSARVAAGYSSTGFVLMSGDTMLYIVTSAHNLNDLFKGSDPLERSTMDSSTSPSYVITLSKITNIMGYLGRGSMLLHTS